MSEAPLTRRRAVQFAFSAGAMAAVSRGDTEVEARGLAQEPTLNLECAERPFALDSATRLMLPDGIFIRSFRGGTQILRARLPNPYFGNARGNKQFVLMSSIDAPFPMSLIGPAIFELTSDAPFFYCEYLVNVVSAPVGKSEVTFYTGRGNRRTENGIAMVQKVIYKGKVFVADANWNNSTHAGVCRVPEGQIVNRLQEIRVGSRAIDQSADDRSQRNTCLASAGWRLPSKVEYVVEYQTPYAGQAGPIPFNDPLWKVAGWVVAALAGLIAGVWLVGGELGWWDSPINSVQSNSTDPATGQICTSCTPGRYADSSTTFDGDPIWGGFLAAAAAGATVGAADMKDPFIRGQENSPVGPTDRTKAEVVRLGLDFKQLPLPGYKYDVGVTWEYRRRLASGQETQPYSVTENVANLHYFSCVRVSFLGGNRFSRATTPEIGATVDLCSRADIARFRDEVKQGLRAREPEFYVIGFLRHRTTGTTKTATFTAASQYGPFTGRFAIGREDNPGLWDLMVVIQNLNNADPKANARVQAGTIGGFTYSRNYELTHEASGGCTVNPRWDATAELV